MLCNLYLLLCCVVLSCKAYSRCDNPPERRSEDVLVQTWPDNTVPYEITDIYTPDQKELIRTGLETITEQTSNCVKFVPRTANDLAWVRVVSKDGCYSLVGKAVQTGAQELSLDQNGCMFKHTVMHEFLHALGFVHEQTRPDRDQYAKILYENIEPKMKDNFDKDPQGALQSYGLPYDFNSIMHYEYNGFTTNCLATIVPVGDKLKHWRYTMGKSEELTPTDIYKIKKIYGCI